MDEYVPFTCSSSLADCTRIGRGTTLHAGMSIAYATLEHLLKNIQCRTLFATHYHELATMLTNKEDGKVRKGVDFYCTDVDQGVRL
jgi:DNA mismatch repair ATPase MutS